MKKFILIILLFTILVFVSIGYADGYSMIFSTDHDTEELERQKQYKVPPIKGLKENLNKNIINTVPENIDRSIMTVPNDGFLYVYDDFILEQYMSDEKRFFVSKVVITNWFYDRTKPIAYSQKVKVRRDWEVSINLQSETEAGNDFLERIADSTGVQVSSSYTVPESETILVGPVDISPRTKAAIKRYTGGYYGSGYLRYKKYSPSGLSWLGYYYQKADGWVVSPTTSTFVFTDSSL